MIMRQMTTRLCCLSLLAGSLLVIVGIIAGPAANLVFSEEPLAESTNDSSSPSQSADGNGLKTKSKTKPAAKSKKPSAPKWEVLHTQPKGLPIPGVTKLPAKSVIKNLESLELTGPQTPEDTFVIGKFFLNGTFGVEDGVIHRTTGANAAITLGSAEDFELEGLVDAEGLGGWFWLVGYEEGSGYMLSYAGKKKSDCYWRVTQLSRGQVVPDTDEIFNTHTWKAPQPLRLVVKDKHLSMWVGTTRLANELELPEYTSGEIITGTYDTKYGALDVKFHSLRIKRGPIEQTKP
jgi:hypothetical protein